MISNNSRSLTSQISQSCPIYPKTILFSPFLSHALNGPPFLLCQQLIWVYALQFFVSYGNRHVIVTWPVPLRSNLFSRWENWKFLLYNFFLIFCDFKKQRNIEKNSNKIYFRHLTCACYTFISHFFTFNKTPTLHQLSLSKHLLLSSKQALLSLQAVRQWELVPQGLWNKFHVFTYFFLLNLKNFTYFYGSLVAVGG